MIQETITYTCDQCGSPNLIRNGTNKCGNRQYHCKDCGVYRVLKPKQGYTDRFRQQVLRAARERVSLRGIERIFGPHRQTVLRWIEHHVTTLPRLGETLLPVQFGGVLEVDEAWSFVARKGDKRWLWTVMCRRTRQIIEFVIGDYSGDTCRRLWRQIPDAYRFCRSYSDFWRAYKQGFPAQSH